MKTQDDFCKWLVLGWSVLVACVTVSPATGQYDKLWSGGGIELFLQSPSPPNNTIGQGTIKACRPDGMGNPCGRTDIQSGGNPVSCQWELMPDLSHAYMKRFKIQNVPGISNGVQCKYSITATYMTAVTSGSASKEHVMIHLTKHSCAQVDGGRCVYVPVIRCWRDRCGRCRYCQEWICEMRQADPCDPDDEILDPPM